MERGLRPPALKDLWFPPPGKGTLRTALTYPAVCPEVPGSASLPADLPQCGIRLGKSFPPWYSRPLGPSVTFSRERLCGSVPWAPRAWKTDVRGEGLRSPTCLDRCLSPPAVPAAWPSSVSPAALYLCLSLPPPLLSRLSAFSPFRPPSFSSLTGGSEPLLLQGGAGKPWLQGSAIRIFPAPPEMEFMSEALPAPPSGSLGGTPSRRRGRGLTSPGHRTWGSICPSCGGWGGFGPKPGWGSF